MDFLIDVLSVQKCFNRLSESPRNKAIYLEYRSSNCSFKDLSKDYNLSVTRIRQIVMRCERKFINLIKE